MPKTKTYRGFFMLIAVCLALVFILNLSLGSVAIPFKDTLAILFGGEAAKPAWEFIVMDYRLPKALTAIWVGGGLGVSGLLMQTLFRNPLAGPFVLGISSGASLGVAFLILGAGAFGGAIAVIAKQTWSLVIAASIGSFLVLLAVLAVSLRVKDTMALLIIGLMFGSITAAVVAVLAYFSPAEQLQRYVFWSFGSLGSLSWNGVLVLSLCCITGLLLSIRAIKPLNALLLGEEYAASVGVQLKKNTLLIIFTTCIFAGSITAFAGPIAFVGLAVPHIARQWIQSADHKVLLPAIFIVGAIIMLVCDSIAQLPTLDYTLPINAITSLFGAPIVIWLLIRKRKLFF